MTTSLSLLTVSFPDCFQGSANIVLAVPVYDGMTYQDLKDELITTSNRADYGIKDWDGLDKAITEWFEDENMTETIGGLDDFEISDNYGIYAYFEIEQKTNA